MTCRVEDCQERHCICCSWRHLDASTLATCPECVGSVRRDVKTVIDLHRVARTILGGWPSSSPGSGQNGSRTADTVLPGGDALALLVGGSEGRMALRAFLNGDSRAVEHEHDNDPPSVEARLGWWEDDIRRAQRLPAASVPPSVAGCGRFLLEHLTWAAQRYDGFDVFAAEIRALRARLERVTGTGEPKDVPAAVPCPDCGGKLARRYGQQGRSDDYTCGTCRRVLTPAEFWLATRHNHEVV